MRSSVAARNFSKKFISTFFAATLALGLVPAAAFAKPANAVVAANEDSESAASALATKADSDTGADSAAAVEAGGNEAAEETPVANDAQSGSADESVVLPNEEKQDDAIAGDDLGSAVPAAGVINQTMPLEVVAQQESTRSYFLAQTLESTKTVPIVSANLPLDKGTNQEPQAGADGGTTVGSEDEVTDSDPSASAEGEGSSEDEGDDGSDESDLGDDALSGRAIAPGVSSESTVVGSFTYLGMTFAVEPGGESVALMAADYAKLPSEFVENQVIVIPGVATSDGIDYYTVVRIADNAFASFKEESANPDFLGAEALMNELFEEGDPVIDEERANPLEGRAGILALDIPASIAQVDDDAFTGFDTLQYVVASEDNPTYGTYDGCLYDAELTSLLFIPEGRLGAVWVAPSATTIDPEVFSHCALVDTVVADPDSAAFQLLQGSDDYSSFLTIEANSEDSVKYIAPIDSGYPDNNDVSFVEDTPVYDTQELERTALAAGLTYRVCLGSPQQLRCGNAAISSGTRYPFAAAGWYTVSTSVKPQIAFGGSTGGVSVTGVHCAAHRSAVSCTGGFQVGTSTGYGNTPSTVQYWNPFTRSWVSVAKGSAVTPNLCNITSLYVRLNGYSTNTPSLPVGEHTITWNAGKFGGEVIDVADDGSSSYLASKSTRVVSTAASPAGTQIVGSIEYPSVRAPEGMKFLGWTKDSTGQTGLISPEGSTEVKDGYLYASYTDDQQLEVAECATYYAVFAIDVAWDAATYGGELSDGSVTTTTTVLVNTAADLPEVAGMGEGWTFEGWIPKGTTPPASGDASYYKDARKPTVTAEMAAANAGGVIEGFEGVWSLAVSFQREEGAIDGMTITGASDAGTGTLARDGIIYGTTVTAPTVQSPASHHFSHWTASDGVVSSPGANDPDAHTITITAPGPVTAYWAPNTRNVVLNSNGGSTSDRAVWSEYDKQMSLYVSNGSGDSPVRLTVPQRAGYEFAGYWNTRYTEDTTNAEDSVPLTTGSTIDNVAPKQYYGVDDAGNLTSLATWDITNNDQQLFAHWRYTVQLNLNTYNHDGEIVLNADRSDFGATMTWPAPVTEQSSANTDNTFTINGKTVEGDSAPTASLALVSHEFTAIAGAPIQLPSFGDRTGYDGGNAWGTTPGSHGAATDIMAYADGTAQVSAAFDPGTLVKIAGDGTIETSDDRYAFVLYADWSDNAPTDANAKSGKARTYQVELKAAYDDFAPTRSDLSSQTVTLTYDKPIPVADLQAAAVSAGKFLEYRTDDTINYLDATKDASGAPRNLVLRGFYTAPATVEAPAAGSKAYLKVKDDAFTNDAIAFREVYAEGQNVVSLYAWWTYNTMGVTFDLQGGTVGGMTAAELPDGALRIENVTSHDVTPDLTATLNAATARAGYEFAGWWNTKYNEKTPEVIGGVTVSPVCYYGPDLSKQPTLDGQPVWLEYTDATLYAHWKYTVEFAVQLPATDIADVSMDAVKETNENVRTHGVVPLLDATDGTRSDLYGNEYTAVEANKDANANSVVKTLTVKAIAGAPVQLPSAQNRRALGAGAYERIGYDATWEWHTAANVTDAADCLALDGDKFTALDDSWTAGYGEAGSLPCKLGRSTFSDNQNRLVLYADWSRAAKVFAIELVYSYDMDNVSHDGTTDTVHYTSDHATSPGHTSDYATVTYDRADYRYVDGDSFTDLAAVDSRGAHAMATFAGQAYDNLDFAGVTTAKKSFFDSSVPNTVYPDAAVDEVYWNAQGVLQKQQFRAIRGADVDVYWSGSPFPLHVAWAQPTRDLAFNMFDAETASDPTTTVIDSFAGGTTKLSLMKDDAVDKPGVSSQLNELAEWIRAYEAKTNYEFGGFWTAPGSYAPYDERANGETDKTQKPTCYYVMNESGRLVGATPTGDGWLTADNTSTNWLEDKATTLYAHWKYAIDFSIDSDDIIPGTDDAARPQGESDLLLFGSPSDGFANAEESIPFGAVDDKQQYTDARGKVTFGAPLVLPVNQDSQGMNRVGRVRDFGRSPAGYGYQDEERGYTGYDFRAWSSQQGKNAVDQAGIDHDSGTVIEHLKLLPQQPGTLTLYSQWTARDFTLTLNHYPQTMYGTKLTANSVKAAGTSQVTVPYDGVYDGAITPPALYGYTYLGYFATDTGTLGTDAGTQQKVSGAGMQYFAMPDNIGDPATDGLSASTGVPWFAPLDDGGAATTSVLYAYFARMEYTMHFASRDEFDATLQETIGRIGGQDHYDQVWYYGDVLREVSGDSHAAPGSARLAFPGSSAETFWRPGYTFEGWYFYPDERSSMTDDEKRALRADKSNRVYLYRVDNTDAANPVGQAGVFTYDGTDGSGADRWLLSSTVNTWRTTGLFDAEQRYTLYAGWAPKVYEVTFNTNYQSEGAVDRTVTKRFFYEQVLTPDDLIQPENTTAPNPYDFVGWNTSRGATHETTEGWLFDKSDYSPDKLDSTVGAPDTGYPIMSGAGGRFMPANYQAESIRLFGIWKKVANKNVVLFRGAHGQLQRNTGAGYEDVPFTVISHDAEDGINLKDTYLQDALKLKKSADTGYTWLGWMELSPTQMGALDNNSYTGLDRTRDEATAYAASIADEVNALELSDGKVFFPTTFNIMDNTLVYENPYNNEGPAFRDVYLVAVYGKVSDYNITLDLGAVADFSDADAEADAGVQMGARLPENGRNGFVSKADATNILYQYGKGFSIDTPNFALPTPVSDMHEFVGWYKDAACTESQKLTESELSVDVRSFIENAGPVHQVTYYAKLVPKTYTVKFVNDHEGLDESAESEDVVLTGLGYRDTFSLPYPATRGAGQFFDYWALERMPSEDGVTTVGEYKAESVFNMRDLLVAIRSNGRYNGTERLGKVRVENDTIVFSSAWNDAIDVTVPLQVLVKVDLENGNVLTADNLRMSTAYGDDSSDGRTVKVVSLRYDRLNTAGEHHAEGDTGSHVFGSTAADAGKVFLSVYPDLQLAEGVDAGQLFYKEKVDAETGALSMSDLASDSPNRPLLIDLSRDAVFVEKYPYVTDESGAPSDAVFEGLYDDAHLDAESDGHGLADHGFRAFGMTNPLPIRYGLLFKGGAEPSDYQLLRDLGAQSDTAIPIAHLYYTVSLA